MVIDASEAIFMLSYMFIGANDMETSARCFDAILSPLGYEKDRYEKQYCFSLPETNPIAREAFISPDL